MERRIPPDKVLQFGRAALDPNRLNPLGGEHFMADDVKTVDKTGVYVLADGTPVRLKEGDVLPEGAKFRDAGAKPEPSAREEEKAAISKAETRDKGAAPENKSVAPENRGQ